MDPMGTVGRIYEDNYYTLLYIKYESPGPCEFGEVSCSSHCKSSGAVCYHGNQSSGLTLPKPTATFALTH